MIFLGKRVQTCAEPFFIAEISANHNGHLSKALRLIKAAKDAGADAVKIQCYDVNSMVLNNEYVIKGENPWKGETLYDLYKKAQTPFDWMEALFDTAKEVGIPLFSSVYDERGLEVLERLNCPAYKIASFEANDPEFIKKVCATGKSIVISTGMLDYNELDRVVQAVKTIENAKDRCVLLHCVSKYPTPLAECNLSKIKYLDLTSLPIGFSCHCDDEAAIFAAIALGACVFEIHLAEGTQDDELSPDNMFSYWPSQLRYTIDRAREVWRAINTVNHNSEDDSRAFRRSLYVVQDIKKGEKFTESHLRSYRPALGCSPHLLKSIIGKEALVSVNAGQPMKIEYVV